MYIDVSLSLVRYATGQTITLTNWMILLAWVMGLVISLPMHLEQPGFSSWSSSSSINSTYHCIPPQDAAHLGYNMYAAILAFILPALVLACFYAAIAIKLKGYHIGNKRSDMTKVGRK